MSQIHSHPCECLFIACLVDHVYETELIATRYLRNEGIVFVPWNFSPDFKEYPGTNIYAKNSRHGNKLNYSRIAEAEFTDLIFNKPCMFARKFGSDARVIKPNGEEVPLGKYLPFTQP